MSLQHAYQQLVRERGLKFDQRQHQVAMLLGMFAEQLIDYSTSKRWLLSKRRPPASHYLYGEVGRGKTMLMDMLYAYLPVRKKRQHFAQFMRWLHSELRAQQGKSNPLDYIAATLAHKTELLCFDELQVIDIADAMLLGRFFNHLIDTGAVLCITSNSHPGELYANGLQRQRFLPVIQRIENEFVLVPLITGADYRRRNLPDAQRYLRPASMQSRQRIVLCLEQLQEQPAVLGSVVRVNARPIASVALLYQAHAAVFCFDELCDTPRNSEDYLALAQAWRVFGLINIPRLDDTKLNQLRRFILLIDVLYDANCACLFSADCSIDAIYTGTAMRVPFARCASRLYSLQHHPLPQPGATHLVSSTSE